MPTLTQTVNFSSYAGEYGSANQTVQLTLDKAGDVMSISNVPIVIANTSVTGLAPSATIDTTNATNITSGTLDQARLPATTVAAGTYGSSNTIPVVVVDATGRLTLASNITTWTTTSQGALSYASGSVGVGTTAPTAALEVVGPTKLNGSVTVDAHDVLSANTLAPTSGSTISLSGASLSNVNNLTLTGSLTLPQAISAPVQVQGVAQTFVVTDESVTTYTLPPIAGYFTGSAMDMDVYMNGKKLAYQNDGVKDYDIAYLFNPTTSNTVYNMTLVYPPNVGDVLDVRMVPTIPTSGYFYQQLAVCNMSPWDTRPADNSIYFTAGSVGVGTTAPAAALDVLGSLKVSGTATFGGQALGAGAFAAGNNASLLTTGTLASNLLPASGVAAGSYGSDTQIPFFKVDASGRITQTSNITLASISANTNASGLTSGTLSSNLLPASGVVAASYGDATHVPSITIDTTGRISSATSVAITSSQWATTGSAIGYASGSVGVGTTAPTADLDVAGSLKVSGAATFGGQALAAGAFTAGNNASLLTTGTLASNLLQASGVAAGAYGDANHVSAITVDSAGRVTSAAAVAITSSQWTTAGSAIGYASGSVGIGTTAPVSALHVVGDISVHGSVIPTSNIAYDLGTPDMRFRDLYLSGNTVHIGDNSISVDSGGYIDAGMNLTASNALFTNVNATYLNVSQVNATHILSSDILSISSTATAILDSAYVAIGATSSSLIDIGTAAKTQYINIGTGSGHTVITVGGSGDVVDMSGTTVTAASINASGAVAAASLAGAGSGLTSLNATNIASGTLDNARLPSAISVTSLAGAGSNLTSLNATNIASGTLDNARLPSNAAFANVSIGTLQTSNLQVLGSNMIVNAYDIFSSNVIVNNFGTGPALSVTQSETGAVSGSAVAMFQAGSVNALAIIGSGSVGIGTTLPSRALDVVGDIHASGSVYGAGSSLTALNATNISSGTLDNAHLPSAISVTSLAGTGSNLTSLNATNISSGTLDNARLPATISSSTLNASFVGVGTTAPQTALDVFGGVRITNSLGTIVFGGH